MNLSVYELRKKHRKFIYRAYESELRGDSLDIVFHFKLEPDISFSPKLSIKGVDKERLNELGSKVLDNFIFHLGLIEIPSYWKAACTPEILIEAGPLDDYQRNWFKKLLLKGLGEFFFANQIDFTSRDFITIRAASLSGNEKYSGKLNPDKFLVPVGGGKDSSLTLDLLRQSSKEIVPFCLNPTTASLEIIKAGKSPQPRIAKRSIDGKLLALNRDGYLNGHTPFSAYLAFLSAFVSVLFDVKTVLLSNARSSNEGNTIYLEEEVNHQYSKSYAFENDFREYLERYLSLDSEYLSFLRPLYELQIAKIFSGRATYFPLFKSCNRGQKTNSWCHNCPKCLFVYTILYPFLDSDILTTRIFNEDLFEKKELIGTMRRFVENSGVKPFDCVGTREETRLAFQLSLEKARMKPDGLPLLLETLEVEKLLEFQDLEKSRKEILAGWDDENFLSEDLKLIIKKAIGL